MFRNIILVNDVSPEGRMLKCFVKQTSRYSTWKSVGRRKCGAY